MSDIISKWLTESLGIIVEIYSETFVRLIQNGYLIAAILRHYNIITADQLTSLTSAGDSDNSIDKIIVWLKRVDIHIDDDTKKAIQNGKISAALELCYKLYLVFQNKEPLHFTTKHIQTEKLRDGLCKFDVKPVLEKSPDPSDIPARALSSVLDENKHIIEWHKDKYKQLMLRCEETRKNYAEFIKRRMKMDEEIVLQSYLLKKKPTIVPVKEEDEISLHENYAELLDQEKKAQDIKPIEPDPRVTKNLVAQLKKKFEKEQKEEAFQKQIETVIMSQFWESLFKEHENKMDAEISQKILKQSYFEKQMATKMFEIREQKDVMTENRIAVLDEIQKKKDEELLQNIFSKEKDSTDERCRYYFERDRALQLHREIYQEKQRLQAQRTCDLCEQIVEDMLDIVISQAEYKETYGVEMPRRMLTDLAALFISSQPIFDLVPNQEVIIEFEPRIDGSEEIYLDEIQRQNAMDIKNFEDYCNFEWPWELETHLPHYAQTNTLCEIQMAMNILGHIVFRLLLTKYPKPPLKPPPNIPKVNMAVCMNNVTDPTVLPILSKLLSERQVKILQMEDAINYCVAAYKDETTVEWPESQFVDETQEALAKVAAKKKNKKSAKDKSNMKRKGEKSKTKKKKPDLREVESIVVPKFKDEQEQTPRIYPCEEPVLSPAAELGRLAYEILNLGEALNDRLLAQMFIEYLKMLKDIDGWVLVNYPTTFEQMTLLEEALTSKPVNTSMTQDEVKPNQHDDDIPEDGETVVKEPLLTSSSGSYGLTKLFATSATNGEHNSADGDKNEGAQGIPVATNDDIETLADLDYRDVEQNDANEDKNAKFRVSRLLTNPDLPPLSDEYDTYMTAFIQLIQKPKDSDLNKSISSEEELDDLSKFYQTQGCLYCLYYNVLDLATIKHIGKLVIGDYSVPPKTSVEIFGDTVLYLENDMNQGEPVPGKISKSKGGGKKKEKKQKNRAPKSGEGDGQEKKDKKNKKEKSDKKSKKEKSDKSSKKEKSDKSSNTKKEKKSKKGKKGVKQEEADVIIVKVDKETQIPEPVLEEDETNKVTLPEPTPGQIQWIYSDLPIPEFFQISLATLWENVEEIYVVDFRELFFRRRVLWKTVIPYLDFVKRYMHDYIDRPDDKQIHLFNFQRIYNEIDSDMRTDEETKAELHCRIYEFREKLREICDNRMREAEEERQNIVMQDWVTKQTCELTTVYITAMQLEIDRCADTLQLLNDYYVAMITKMPCQEQVLEKVFLEYIVFKDDFEFESHAHYSDFVKQNLIQIQDMPPTSPYHEIISKNCHIAINAAEKYQNNSLHILSNMESYFLPKGKKHRQTKDPKVKGKLKLPKFSAPDPDVKDVGLKLIEEWKCAIHGEFERVCLRLNLLTSVSSEGLKDMLVCSTKVFHGLFDDIKERYDKEMGSVEECCNVLFRAVEEEMAIQPELVLEGDRFFINPNVLLFEDPLPEPEPELHECEKPEVFTIRQLSYLADILLDFAPSGIMPERTFSFLLQDMIVNNAEDGKPPMVPPLWRQITPKNMNVLSYEFFGNVEFVDWKDFIICNLCVDFPDEIQLMDTRRQFRELDVDSKEYIYEYQFETVSFWFENQFNMEDPRESLRLREMKDLLSKIYRINQETINYTALLLAFCKDEEPYLGVAKALQLSLGKFVCWDANIGDAFLEILRMRRLEELQIELQKEAEEAAKVVLAGEIVESLVESTLHVCDSCYLESYESTTSVKEEEEVMDPELMYLEDMMKDYETGYEYQQYEGGSEYFLQEHFSNIEIGFEPELYPSKVYYLPFEVLITVMMAAMPWQAIAKNPYENSFRQKLQFIYEECKSQEFEDVVLMHEFLHSESLRRLLEDNFKFTTKKPSEIIIKLLEDK